MNNELIIDASGPETVVALLNDKRLMELHREKSDTSFSVGDIYLGRVKKIMPGLNAAFVDVGYEKDAFLHYFDLGPQLASLNKFIRLNREGKLQTHLLKDFHLERDINKRGKINQVLQSGQAVVVQVAKEPISTKGPRISSELSLAGRYLVLVPFYDTINVSQKIRRREERDRLKRLIQSIKPKNFGVIIRTVAENKTTAELDADLTDLVKKWEALCGVMRKAQPPSKILGEIDRTNVILRDMLNASFSAIYVNDNKTFEELRAYLRSIAPDKEKILRPYKGNAPIFDQFGVEKQIKQLFGKNVNMKSGAYLIIEHTEAMHVIDVNSGHRTRSEKDQETNALEVNMEAAAEIARQLRLRDMGGIIVIDFIDLHNPNNRKALYNKLVEEMKVDRARHNIIPPSKFGLVQITRERVRPQTNIITTEKCPACGGTGEVQSSMLLLDNIENNIEHITKTGNRSALTVCVHPFLEAYVNRGMFSSVAGSWGKKYKRKIKVKPVSNYHLLEYHFFNENEEEIKI